MESSQVPSGGFSLPIPLVGGHAVTVGGTFPISEAAWLHFLTVLDALKPGLVVPSSAGPDGDA